MLPDRVYEDHYPHLLCWCVLAHAAWPRLWRPLPTAVVRRLKDPTAMFQWLCRPVCTWQVYAVHWYVSERVRQGRFMLLLVFRWLLFFSVYGFYLVSKKSVEFSLLPLLFCWVNLKCLQKTKLVKHNLKFVVALVRCASVLWTLSVRNINNHFTAMGYIIILYIILLLGRLLWVDLIKWISNVRP